MQTNISAEKAIHFLTKHFPVAKQGSRKPALFHDIRVGTYLYNHGYNEKIIVAGFLHDCLEWSRVNEGRLEKEFGKDILQIAKANSKDNSIENKEEKIRDMIY
ncbi:HD domain-containing protein [Candidatus Nomurabacteria bacterium]|nr:HD domain-containing protein [Candidatus Nomurabacteria bacterium]